MTKLVVFIGFCIAFVAGLTVGVQRQRSMEPGVAAPPTTHPAHRGFLPSELNLTPQQQEQMSKIWSDAHGGRGETDDRRRELREKRDNEIAALIPSQDKPKYEKALN